MASQEFFTPIAFDFLWEALGVGELPYPLHVSSHGQTEHERAVLRRQVHEQLQARGIRDEHGQLEPRIEYSLGLLARHTMSIDALHIPDFEAPPVTVLAASDGHAGVLAIQNTKGTWVRPAFVEGLASAVVELLPPGQRGTEASITLPLEDAMAIKPAGAPVSAGARGGAADTGKTGRRQHRPRAALSERPANPAETYARLAGQPRLRGGQLAANSRSFMGGRQRSPVLGWFDTATGRYLSLSRPGRDSREWVTVSPADAKTLRTRLGEMLSEVDGTR